MANELMDDEWATHSILHQTKDKYRELASSLMLTSSLMSHKQKINKHRHDQIQPDHKIFSSNEVLITNKIGFFSSGKEQLIEANTSLSNIDQLKCHAKMLMD